MHGCATFLFFPKAPDSKQSQITLRRSTAGQQRYLQMGLYYQKQLTNNDNKNSHSPTGATGAIYRCANCHTHIFQASQVVSDSFTGVTGEGLLVSRAVNLDEGKTEKREFRTGMYQVRDVYCVQCHNYLGWRYIKSSSQSERYKEHMLVMEANELSRTG